MAPDICTLLALFLLSVTPVLLGLNYHPSMIISNNILTVKFLSQAGFEPVSNQSTANQARCTQVLALVATTPLTHLKRLGSGGCGLDESKSGKSGIPFEYENVTKEVKYYEFRN